MQLSDKQLELVELKVHEAGLQNHELQVDLLDHIACMIEDMMENNHSFDQAFEQAFQTYNQRHLKRIEFTTRILTTSTMKKHTKILGIVGLVLATAGTSMKMLHLPGAAIILTLAAVVLALGFVGSNAMDTIKNLDNAKGKFVQIIGAIGALFTLAGGMFKLLHLPGAGILIIAGPALLIIYFSFSSFLRTKTVE